MKGSRSLISWESNSGCWGSGISWGRCRCISWSWGNIWDSLTLILHISNITRGGIKNIVGDNLGATIGEFNAVLAVGGITIAVLIVSITGISSVGISLNSIAEFVNWWIKNFNWSWGWAVGWGWNSDWDGSTDWNWGWGKSGNWNGSSNCKWCSGNNWSGGKRGSCLRSSSSWCWCGLCSLLYMSMVTVGNGDSNKASKGNKSLTGKFEISLHSG